MSFLTSPLDSIRSVLLGESRWAVVHAKWQDVLPSLDNGFVAHVICDPPYSEHVHSKSRAGAQKKPLRDGNGHLTKCAIDREVEFGFDCITIPEMESFADQCERLAQRWTLAFCDVESVALWQGAMSSAGLVYKRTCSWEKEGCTPQFTGDRPAVGFECIVCSHRTGRSKWNGGGKRGVYHHWICQNSPGKSCDNDNRVHPTQKPLSLMLDLVADFTDRDDVVLDPFCGSATTGVACLRLGRRFIGVEMQEKHVESARLRLQAEEEGSSLAALKAGQLAMFGGGK